jgi:hypothetical protein
MGQKWVVEQKRINPLYIIVHLSLNTLLKWKRWVFEAGGTIILTTVFSTHSLRLASEVQIQLVGAIIMRA